MRRSSHCRHTLSSLSVFFCLAGKMSCHFKKFPSTPPKGESRGRESMRKHSGGGRFDLHCGHFPPRATAYVPRRRSRRSAHHPRRVLPRISCHATSSRIQDHLRGMHTTIHRPFSSLLLPRPTISRSSAENEVGTYTDRGEIGKAILWISINMPDSSGWYLGFRQRQNYCSPLFPPPHVAQSSTHVVVVCKRYGSTSATAASRPPR